MSSQPTVFLVDDDDGVRDSLTLSLTKSGLLVEAFASAEAFLEAVDPSRAGCLVLDVRMPAGMNGPDLQEALQDKGWSIPIIFLSGHGSVPLSVQTVKRGALNFLEKPFKLGELTEQIALAFEQDSEQRSRLESQQPDVDRVRPPYRARKRSYRVHCRRPLEQGNSERVGYQPSDD